MAKDQAEALGKSVPNKLSVTKSVNDHERAAAIWIAKSPEEEQEIAS